MVLHHFFSARRWRMGARKPGLAISGGSPVRRRPFPPWPVHTTSDRERVRAGSPAPGSTDLAGEFARTFAAYHGAAHGACTASGSAALTLALRALGVQFGDEVIVPAYCCRLVAFSALQAGAVPVFADVDPETYCLDPEAVRSTITSRTRAIVAVHLAMRFADLEALLAISARTGVAVIEDCAQAHGAQYHGRLVGGLGHLSAFSFYPTKNLGAYGYGGAVLTNDSALAERVRLMRQYGWRENRISEQKGMNARLDEMQAAILRVKLCHLEKWNERRRELVAFYKSLLPDSLTLPVEPPETHHVYHQFVVRHSQRDALRNYLLERGIHTQIHYPVPIHLQPAYRELASHLLPMTEAAADQILSLPLYPELRDKDVKRVCQAIQMFVAHLPFDYAQGEDFQL